MKKSLFITPVLIILMSILSSCEDEKIECIEELKSCYKKTVQKYDETHSAEFYYGYTFDGKEAVCKAMEGKTFCNVVGK